MTNLIDELHLSTGNAMNAETPVMAGDIVASGLLLQFQVRSSPFLEMRATTTSQAANMTILSLLTPATIRSEVVPEVTKYMAILGLIFSMAATTQMKYMAARTTTRSMAAKATIGSLAKLVRMC